MKPVYVYPGTFSPPTIGHLSVVCQAAKLFPEIIILCSENPDKDTVWFSPDECKKLWQTYRLPKNVKILTLIEFKLMNIPKGSIVLIRGLRNDSDYKTENAVISLNKEKFGITKYFFIFGAKKYSKLSSSRVRGEAEKINLAYLKGKVSPLIITALLEKVLKARNIFLVVGRTGSGKSTALKFLCELSEANCWIDADSFSQELRPLLIQKLGNVDLIQVANEDGARLKKIIAKPWIALLKKQLLSLPAGLNIFIEIAYGLQADKSLFRFVGGKVMYVGCDNNLINEKRISLRGTPSHSKFINKIPGRMETSEIAEENNLSISYLNTDCPIKTLKEKLTFINNLITKGQYYAYDI